ECVRWDTFNQMVMDNIAENRRGLDIRGFRRELEASQETYVANATPVRRQGQPQPQVQEPVQQPEQQMQLRGANGRLTDDAWREISGSVARPDNVSGQTWNVALTQMRSVFDSSPELTEQDMRAYMFILGRSATDRRFQGELRLTMTNLRARARSMDERH